jgi:hypothetical protein
MSSQPAATDQILIGVAHCVVMNFGALCQGAHAWHLFAWVELPGRNQENDLLRELLPQRNLAVLAD